MRSTLIHLELMLVRFKCTIAGFENQKLVEWQVHSTKEQVRRVGGPEKHARHAAQVDSSKRNAAS